MSVPGPDDRGEFRSAQARQTRPVAAPPEAVGVASNGRSIGVFLKDIALFFAAPFVTIAYLTLFPFIGVAMLVRARGQAGRKPRVGS